MSEIMSEIETKVVKELTAKITPPIVGQNSTSLPPDIALPPVSLQEDVIKNRVEYLYQLVRYHKDFNLYQALDSQIALQKMWINRCSLVVQAIIQQRLARLTAERTKIKQEVISFCYAALMRNERDITHITRDREGYKRAKVFFSILDDLDIEDTFWCLSKPFCMKKPIARKV